MAISKVEVYVVDSDYSICDYTLIRELLILQLVYLLAQVFVERQVLFFNYFVGGVDLVFNRLSNVEQNIFVINHEELIQYIGLLFDEFIAVSVDRICFFLVVWVEFKDVETCPV